eukprot:TRINITY_DN324_c0_g1_i1.p1 TRINITY_DN324_c0_g1~~TRINITY_DN324_c0_g1_i1.p1  ORF type:complete len:729 (-),score=110.24 TRINITY_DN324_c0_g1_i1:7787-9973(-)
MKLLYRKMQQWIFRVLLCTLFLSSGLFISAKALPGLENNAIAYRTHRFVPHHHFWHATPEYAPLVREESSIVDPYVESDGNEKLEEEAQEAAQSQSSDSEAKPDSESIEEQPKDEEPSDSVDSNDQSASVESDAVNPTEMTTDSTNSAESTTSDEGNAADASADSGESETSNEVETKDAGETVTVDPNDPSTANTDDKGDDETSTTEENQTQPEQPESLPLNGTENATEQESPALPSNTTEGKNDTNAFLAFKLRQMLETDSDTDEAFHLVTIFEEGAFTGPFADSPSSTNIDEISSSETEKWYMESAYSDRISFRLDYTPESSDYKISEPTIAVTSEAGIEPVLQDFQNNPENGEGSFSIVYRCLPEGSEESYISLHLQVTGTHSIDTAWKKVCGRGRHEHMEFGFTSYNLGTVLFNKDGTYGTEEQKILEVGPLDTSTEITMKLAPPAYTLDFKDPYVTSDSDYVSVALRGRIVGGTVTSDEQTKFSVLYECLATATANIVFSVAIPPWDNMTAVWRKDCGGRHSQSLLIGTSGEGSYEVVHEGEVSLQYNITDNTYIGDVEGVVEEIPGNTDYRKFYVTNSDDTSDIQVQTVSMTMSDPSIVTPIIQTSMVAGSSYLSASGGVIGRKETKSLYLHFICKKEGKSLVLVTLPILRYRNIEFGFIKDCFEPRVHRHSGFLQTAGSIMGFMLLLAVIGGGAGWVYWRRRSRRMGKKYTAVATSERDLP